jgi:phosphoserine aminotransferase
MEKARYYFGAGPAALPKEVLKEASEAVIEYRNTGLSILEIPHRNALFEDILEESKALVRSLCGLGEDEWEVLWLPGGRLQFSMIPMNFLRPDTIGGYADTGSWAAEALENAEMLGDAEAITSAREGGYTSIPPLPESLPQNLAYLHITSNNTIEGTQWAEFPDTGSVPLFVDVSSDVLGSLRDYSRCSLYWAVVQKNLGAAGVTLVCVRKELLRQEVAGLTPMLSYSAQVAKNSVLNTPPVFAIYTAMLMLRWTAAKGLDVIDRENREKAETLYAAIERSPHFYAPAEKGSRSRMNVVFRGQTKELEKAFLSACNQRGLAGLEGHRTAGGFRASLYNAVPKEAVTELVKVMDTFEP